jgi:hypothetical protein
MNLLYVQVELFLNTDYFSFITLHVLLFGKVGGSTQVPIRA